MFRNVFSDEFGAFTQSIPFDYPVTGSAPVVSKEGPRGISSEGTSVPLPVTFFLSGKAEPAFFFAISPRLSAHRGLSSALQGLAALVSFARSGPY